MKLSRLVRRDPAAPTLRDRAAALREGLSRRDAVLGVAAATVPLPALASGQPAQHPDADLMALWQQREEAYRVERIAFAKWDAIAEATEVVALPEAVFRREGDEALGIGGLAHCNGDGRPWYCVGNLGSAHRASVLRKPRRRNFERPVRPEDNLPANAFKVCGSEPWPEAQARADEIVTAWDRYEAEAARYNRDSGHDAAIAEWESCDAAMFAVEEQIARSEARTLVGLTIKARLVQAQDERGDRFDTDLAFEVIQGLAAIGTADA